MDLDGWMIHNFTSFLTAFQLYQDEGRVIMQLIQRKNEHSEPADSLVSDLGSYCLFSPSVSQDAAHKKKKKKKKKT